MCRLQRVSPWVHEHLNIDYSSAMILTPFNYHEWKAKIGILLHSKGLYRVSMALENEPNYVVEKAKWHNRWDEAYGLLYLSISPYILFHLDGMTTWNQVWTKLESLFGFQDELRAHQLENELFSLIQSSFDSIEGFYTKLKSLVLFIKKYGIEKNEYQMIIFILSKLDPEYSVFVSTFSATRLAISNWKIPSLSTLFDSLTKEQDKLIQMSALRTFKGKDHALIVQGSKNTKSK